MEGIDWHDADAVAEALGLPPKAPEVTVDYWLDRWREDGRHPTADDVFGAMCMVGRVPAVGLLADAWWEGLLAEETLAELVADAWSGAEYPERTLGADDWRALFEVTGYVLDDRRGRAPRPAESLTLYRGAMPEHRLGWAWTDDLDRARRFASGGMLGRGRGSVYVAEVEPWRLFCRCDGRQEREYVIDTEGLAVTLLEDGAERTS